MLTDMEMLNVERLRAAVASARKRETLTSIVSRARLCRRQVEKILAGKITDPRWSSVVLLAEAVGVPLEELRRPAA